MSLSGFCSGPAGVQPDCERCPGVFPEHTWPDPARKGTTYTIPERICTHECHSRQFTQHPLDSTST